MIEDRTDAMPEDDAAEGRGAMTMAVGSVAIFVLTILYILVASR